MFILQYPIYIYIYVVSVAVTRNLKPPHEVWPQKQSAAFSRAAGCVAQAPKPMGSQDTACPLKVGVGPKTKKRAGKKVKCLTSMLKLHCVARNSHR